MDEKIAFHNTDAVYVSTFGRQLDAFCAIKQSQELQSPWLYLVKPAQDRRDEGFQTVYDFSQRAKTCQGIETIKADGLVVPAGSSVAINSKDCPIVVLTATEDRRTVVLHAGREALTSYSSCGTCHYNIISAGLRAVRGNDKTKAVEVYITAGICQNCFVHDLEKDKEKLQYFFEHHPELISGDGGLDLVQIIHQEIRNQHANLPAFSHDKLCTRCYPNFSSYRNRDETSNLVVVSSL